MCACVRATSLIAPTGRSPRQQRQPPPRISSSSLVTRRPTVRAKVADVGRREIGGQVRTFPFFSSSSSSSSSFPSFFCYYLFLSHLSILRLAYQTSGDEEGCAHQGCTADFLLLISPFYFSFFFGGGAIALCFVFVVEGGGQKCADNSAGNVYALSRFNPRERETRRLWNCATGRERERISRSIDNMDRKYRGKECYA